MSSSQKQLMARFGYVVTIALATLGLCILAMGVRDASAISLLDQDITPSVYEQTEQAVLVEMFLSQSCSSCVPAARYVSDLATREDVVVLSWHVDYWDDLFVSGHGRWKDPYSSRAFTDRQRLYAINASSGGRIYTPQAVISGAAEAVGSRRREIDQLIASNDQSTAIQLNQEEDVLSVQLDNVASGQDILLVTFYRQTETSIKGGENNGREWFEANVVSDVQSIGRTEAARSIYNAKFPEDASRADMHCAVIVQEPGYGKVSAAAYCPA